MQKKIQSLKLVVPFLTLLVIVGTAFAGRLPSVLASSLSNFSTSTSCAGNNYSNLPNSDCNSNTPYPSQGSCQLAWINGGGGTVALDVSKVGDDQGLRSTLGGYNLRCAADVKATSCTLTPGANDSGNINLDLANVMNRSPWIYQHLNGQFGLSCNTTTSTNATNNSNSYFYIVSGLDGSRYVDIQNGRTDPGTDGIPIVAYNKNYPPTDNQLWTFVSDAENDGYGYLQSKSNLILDIQGGQTNPGACVIAFTKDASESDNQLWKFVSDGMNGGVYGYLQSKSNLVLDIPGSSPNRSKPLIAYSQDQPLSPNQIWIKVPQF